MKTIFTMLTMLLSATFLVHAKQGMSEIEKLKSLSLKNTLAAKGGIDNPFKQLILKQNQLSVPGFSEDFSWDGDLNDWQHVSNTTYSYDGTGRLTEEIAREAGTDFYLSRKTYSYDLFGNTTEEVTYIRGFDDWIPVNGNRSVYTISAESQINGVIEQTLENGTWVNKVRTEYFLNANQIPIGMQTYQWNGNDWILESKTVNMSWADWNTRKLAAYTLQYRQNETWINGERYSTQFNGNNYTATTERWVNGAWANSKRESYSRTDTREEFISENWTTLGWEKAERYLSTFDDKGNPTAIQFSTWNNTEWAAETEFFFDLTYNESDYVTKMVVRYRDPDFQEPVNLSKFSYSSFLHFTTGVPEINKLTAVKVFPNPAGSSFNIQLNEPDVTAFQATITNLAGQTVFSKRFSGFRNSVTIDYLVRGTYILTIKTDNGKTHHTKLIKD